MLLGLVCQSHAGLEWESQSITLKAAPGESFVEVEFIGRNTGMDSVVIEKIRTACNCTSAKAAIKTIAPGENGIIVGRFDFGAREGIQRKRFVVFTSDGDQVSLYLTIDIPRTYRVAPRRLTWSAPDDPAAKSCRMINESRVP